MTKRLVIYFLISIPMAFALMKIIEFKITWVFWLYIGIMGISGFIAEEFLYSQKKSKFIKITEHVAFISAITLILWYIACNFL